MEHFREKQSRIESSGIELLFIEGARQSELRLIGR